MARTKDSALVPVERITHSILILRGQRVLLDARASVPGGVTSF